jgi:LPXTG-motif cell wall-anchored protein
MPTPMPTVETPTPNASGDTLVPDDDGGYLELDEAGIPRGDWQYDEDRGIWIFEPFTPLDEIPKTGDSAAVIWVAIAAISGAVFVLTAKKKADTK